MKTVFIAVLFIAMQLPCSAKLRLYSRDLAEKHVADSLRLVDSLRVVDSIRIADSCMISRYKTADTVRKKETQLKTDSVYSAMFIFEDAAPEAAAVPDDADAVSARTIRIDPDSPLTKVIDSLEAQYDLKNNLLHDGDPHFKTMKIFAISEKQRYLRFLLDNKLKTREQVAAYCNALSALYNIRLEFFLALQKSQEGNARSFVRLHIENHRKKMEELSAFILALTPEVPFYPEREGRKD